MKTNFNVLWVDVAEKDLIEIVEHIARDDPTTATKILGRLKSGANSLHNFPERGRIVPELFDQGISVYHELVESPWRIIYRVEQNKVLVLSVLDSRRNVEDILLRRLIQIRS